MSAVDTPTHGEQTSTVYQRQQAEKKQVASGKVTHTDFLKLLTQQLVNQDPLNPMEDINFTGQLAQLQALDEQMAMTKSMQGMRIDSQLQSGTNMIGKFVAGMDETGESINGIVKRVSQSNNEVFVELHDGRKVNVSDISNVWDDSQSMNDEIANSSAVIGMWVECGYDEAMQPIKGIVESMQVVDGRVTLKLYGGTRVTWDQIQNMRIPTKDEEYYYLPDSVRAKVEEARKLVGMTVDGVDTEGNEVKGKIVADAVLNGTEVYLLFHDETTMKLEDVKGDAREPSADDLAKNLDGFWVEGLDTEGEKAKGIVCGAGENEEGDLFLILDTGQRVYTDAVSSARAAEGKDKAHLHGQWVTGKDKDGNAVSGVVTNKLTLDNLLSVEIKDGNGNTYYMYCKDMDDHRDATTEEAAAVKQQQEDEKNNSNNP